MTSRPAPTLSISPGERRLAARCRRGDRAALGEFFRQYSPAVERMVGRLLGRSPVYEDLVQTTFVEAIRSFPNFRGEASLATWVSRIAVHVVHRHFREKTRRPVALEVIEPGAEPRARGASPPVEVARRLLARRLFGVLEKLTAKKRIAFVLHAIEGYSVDEVAALMGAGRAATRSRLWFARREIDAHVAADPVLAQAALEMGDIERDES